MPRDVLMLVAIHAVVPFFLVVPLLPLGIQIADEHHLRAQFQLQTLRCRATLDQLLHQARRSLGPCFKGARQARKTCWMEQEAALRMECSLARPLHSLSSIGSSAHR